MSIGACPIGATPIGATCPGTGALAPVFAGAITELRNEWPPPDGYRRVLDTSGIDLAARREATLEAYRREIGLIRDEPPAPVIRLPVVSKPDPAAREPASLPIMPAFDPVAYAAIVAKTLARTLAEGAAEARAAREAIEQDNESVLLLLAAVI